MVLIWRRSWELTVGIRNINIIIFGVSVFDIYNVATQYLAYEDISHELFCDLAE